MRYRLAVALLSGLVSLPAVATADRGDQTNTGSGSADRVQAASSEATEAEKKPSPWHGSILLFDQSATTSTLGMGQSYNGSNQSYELWFALKPRYALYETKATSIALNLWTNLYLELTNSDSTTTEHEPLLGPTFLSASFGQTLFERSGYKTSFNLGPRVTLPTDKESRNSGRYLALGASGGVSQSIPLAGQAAPTFNGLRFGVSSIYGHPFNRATVPTTTSDVVLKQPRQDVAGRLVFGDANDQLRSGMNVRDSVSVSFSGGVQVTPRLDIGLSYVISNSWKYWPKPASVATAGGMETPQETANPTNHSVSTWALASIDYEALDEMSVGVGYYNQTNQIGPDGQRRSPLWSPEARIFLTLTGNLDVLYQTLTVRPVTSQTASARP